MVIEIVQMASGYGGLECESYRQVRLAHRLLARAWNDLTRGINYHAVFVRLLGASGRIRQALRLVRQMRVVGPDQGDEPIDYLNVFAWLRGAFVYAARAATLVRMLLRGGPGDVVRIRADALDKIWNADYDLVSCPQRFVPVDIGH